MITVIDRDSFGEAWYELLGELYYGGEVVSPRGLKISEIRDVVLRVNNSYENILLSDIRKPSYRFMVAEWLWIWFGRDDVKTIVQYNAKIADFSDNGVNFNGSYGVPIRQQWNRTLELLRKDPETRQAIVQIYKTPHGPTKDVPCTLATQYFIREGYYLHTSVYMRSSDIWLGLPYDFFNVTMMANILAAQLGITLGPTTFHLGSSHLYQNNEEMAGVILETETKPSSRRSPQFTEEPSVWLNYVLANPTVHDKNARGRDQIWQCYANALASPASETLDHLPAV